MKRKSIVLLGLAALLCAWPSISSATTIFIGTGAGNDFESSVESVIDAYSAYTGAKPVDIDFYAKVDYPATASGGLTLTYNAGNKSGTWSTNDPIDFFSVKAGNGFAVYWVDPAYDSGSWTTLGLFVGQNQNQPEISHLSAWRLKTPVGVPEPATLMMLGLGLIAVTGFKRRFVNN